MGMQSSGRAIPLWGERAGQGIHGREEQRGWAWEGRWRAESRGCVGNLEALREGPIRKLPIRHGAVSAYQQPASVSPVCRWVGGAGWGPCVALLWCRSCWDSLPPKSFLRRPGSGRGPVNHSDSLSPSLRKCLARPISGPGLYK